MKTIVLNEKQGLQVGFNDWEKANCPTITTVGIVDGEFSHRIKNSLIKIESVEVVDSLISELKEFRKIVAKYEKKNTQKEEKPAKSKKKNTSDVDVTIATLSSLGYSKEEIAKMLNKKEGKKSSKKANKK
jgi:alanyl-tRNA synthetase